MEMGYTQSEVEEIIGVVSKILIRNRDALGIMQSEAEVLIDSATSTDLAGTLCVIVLAIIFRDFL